MLTPEIMRSTECSPSHVHGEDKTLHCDDGKIKQHVDPDVSPVLSISQTGEQPESNMNSRLHVPRRLTTAIVRAFGMTQVEARCWFRRPHAAFGGQSPEDVAQTIEGIRRLVSFLETLNLSEVAE